jgi:hypothetical protein
MKSAQRATIILPTFYFSIYLYTFLFNPIDGYKKAMIQNLEFIADKEALKKIADKAYQLTLLKITTQENCVAITNHFINH